MPLTREMAVDVGVKAREALSGLYGPRLKGAYHFGSVARGEGTADSDPLFRSTRMCRSLSYSFLKVVSPPVATPFTEQLSERGFGCEGRG
ncbi:MAG: hypothetical protein GHCLOJNM_01401 [bacterium]|nr:hypothetical protein [bacterium]